MVTNEVDVMNQVRFQSVVCRISLNDIQKRVNECDVKLNALLANITSGSEASGAPSASVETLF